MSTNKRNILVDVFSGVGGFALGFKNAGVPIHKHFFSEIDLHAIANYKYNFRNAQYLGSVKYVRHIINTINAYRRAGDTLIFVFGSPCQDFSMAGERAGLGGNKSSLIRFALFLIKWLKPDLYTWENVKGTFSSNAGADFWTIIKAFANCGAYNIEWQLLDTAWVLPQNRERIYIVGHATTGSTKKVFPIQENDRLFGKTFATEKRSSQAENCSTITHNFGSNADSTFIKVATNNAKGFEVAGPGDSINYSNINSTTRRGRVGKKPASTLDTHANLAVIDNTEQLRRLTEIECERLQGFPDNWTQYGYMPLKKISQNKFNTLTATEQIAVFQNTVKKPISSTQRYKQMGNAVTAEIVKKIAIKLELPA
ncbi:MAG: DNA (cytosine-5-)-methyltransferase [Bacteroidota bacterium]